MLVFITLSNTSTWIIVHFNGEFWASLGAQTVKYLLAMQETGFNPGLGEFPGEGNGNPLQYLPGESHGQKTWQATVHGVTKNQTQLSKEQFHFFTGNSN